ncbi:keratin, type II cytoskeletal 2 epidermal-like isoform X1 [Cydia pomonella]|uniref:keratin, type II cytoskeletal 2 epidermal-like isoform X1 n=1 Tax=Cydia pomonella TaxID=82600 RepID=UPI002ADE1285|nr:keratin, type II cytoskeletal 2 epidermal-like isoform X1 [Cydia pomonella]
MMLKALVIFVAIGLAASAPSQREKRSPGGSGWQSGGGYGGSGFSGGFGGGSFGDDFGGLPSVGVARSSFGGSGGWGGSGGMYFYLKGTIRIHTAPALLLHCYRKCPIIRAVNVIFNKKSKITFLTFSGAMQSAELLQQYCSVTKQPIALLLQMPKIRASTLTFPAVILQSTVDIVALQYRCTNAANYITATNLKFNKNFSLKGLFLLFKRIGYGRS